MPEKTTAETVRLQQTNINDLLDSLKDRPILYVSGHCAESVNVLPWEYGAKLVLPNGTTCLYSQLPSIKELPVPLYNKVVRQINNVL